jgi:hypothetical protein
MMVRTTVLLALISISALETGLPASDGVIQRAPTDADDRTVLLLVFEQIRLRAGTPALHVSRDPSQPVGVVDHARPICRPKVTEHEMPWPFLCAPDPLGVLKSRTSAQLPDWLRSTGLTDADQIELVRSFEHRNSDWHALPRMKAQHARMFSRKEYFDGDTPTDFVVFSLPGYSARGLAIVYARFSCGSLCGTSYIVVLQRSRSSWQIVSPLVGLGVS